MWQRHSRSLKAPSAFLTLLCALYKHTFTLELYYVFMKLNRCSFLNLLRLGIMNRSLFFWTLSVSTSPGPMNHLELIDLLIVSFVSESAFPLQSLSSGFGQQHEVSLKEDLKWREFSCAETCTCAGVSVSCEEKENPLTSISLCVWNWMFWFLQTQNRGEKKKKKHSIWYFSRNQIQDGKLQQYVVSGLCLKEGYRKESAPECVCVWLNGRSCYNIGLCCGECWSPAVARYSAALHPKQSKQKTHQGYTRLARHRQVTNPHRHNGVIALSPVIMTNLQTANHALLPNATNAVCSDPLGFSCLNLQQACMFRNTMTTRMKEWKRLKSWNLHSRERNICISFRMCFF